MRGWYTPHMEGSLLSLKTPSDVAKDLAARLRELRLAQDWTRASLASRAGVTAASLKRFETTGEASLALVLKVALALDRLDELDALFQPPRARSLAELEEQARRPRRQRGRR